MDGYLVQLQIFQKARSEASPTSLTAYQLTLTDQGLQRIIVECSSFEPLQSTTYFPVGACSGELPGSDGQKRVGVTFRRLVLP